MTAMDATARGGRYLLLDGLRGMAALVIVIHHFTALSGQREIFGSASVAVDFFFCLGGFVIAHAYEAKLLAGLTVSEYVRRRLVRLYPMFLVGCLIGLVALTIGKEQGANDMSWAGIEEAAVLNALYLPYPHWYYIQIFEKRLVGVVFPLNGPAWSLFFALFANLIYAQVIRKSPKLSPLIAAVSAVALVAAGLQYGEAPGWGTANFVGGFPRVMFAFFAGVTVYQLQPTLARLPRIHPAVIAIVAVAVLSVPHFRGHIFYWLFATIGGVPILVAMAGDVRPMGSRRAQALCAYSGGISYAMFCVHYPLLMLFALAFQHSVSLAMLALYLATTFALSHALHRYVERPMREWLDMKIGMAHP